MTADVFQLGVSLLFATLRLDIRPESYRNDDRSSVLFRLERAQSAVYFTVYSSYLLVDGKPLTKLNDGPFALALRCDSPLQLAVNVSTPPDRRSINSTRKYIVISPALCDRYSEIAIRLLPDDQPLERFAGCLTNGMMGDRPLFQSKCRSFNRDVEGTGEWASNQTGCDAASMTESRSVKNTARSVTETPTESTHANSETDNDLIRLGARLRVREGNTALLGFANVYLAPGHRRRWPALNDNYALVKFDIVTQPEHGRLTFVGGNGHRLAGFSYADLMDGRVEYCHDGSESVVDSIDFQVKIEVPSLEAGPGWLERHQKVFTLRIDVESVDDAPQLRAGFRGNVLQLVLGGRIRLSESYLRVWDTDTAAGDVWISVCRADGALVINDAAHQLTRFNQTQLLAGEVFIASDGSDGSIEFCAGDCTAPDASRLTLRVTSALWRLRAVANTGIALSHRSTVLIGAQNLSFSVDFDSEAHPPIRYVIVDQPKFGVVECQPRSADTAGRRPDRNHFQICAQFEQSDVDEWRVRYRHTSDSRSQSDTIGFQVYCGESSTPVHVLHVNLIAVRFRVFTRTPFVLNATLEAWLSAENLLTSAFPANPPPDQLLYHIVEPPRYGMLTRRIDGGKFRRIGVSSNFTQAHINDAALLYRLHYVQYAPLRDHFAYRLVTASATSELMRFEIGYLPGPNSLSLVNRTLIVAEGAKQIITNSTLWLETPDERDFRFTVVVAPFNGRLSLEGTGLLSFGNSFTSADILVDRLSYEHCGDETATDRWLLAAQSVKTQQSLRFNFWLAASIVPANDNAPHLRRQLGSAEDVTAIALIEEMERVLHPSMLPWLDVDWSSRFGTSIGHTTLSFHVAELFRDFIICTRDAPELSIRNFTSRQLEERSLIVRHLNLRKNTNKLRYTVNDGAHTVESTLRFIASPPFIRLSAGGLDLPTNFTQSSLLNANTNSNRQFVLLTGVHLTADTNLNVDPDTICFERLHMSQPSPFRLTNAVNGTWSSVNSFTQRDIHDGHVFLALTPSAAGFTVPLRISAGNDSERLNAISPSTIFSGFTSLFRSTKSRESTKSKTETSLTRLLADVTFSVRQSVDSSLTSHTIVINSKASDGNSNQEEQGVTVFDCIVGSSAVVDARVFAVGTLWPPAVDQVLDAKFFIIRPPRFGILTLDGFGNDSTTKSFHDPSSYPVDGFRQSDLDAGRLRYVNVNASTEHDDFVVRVSVPSLVFFAVTAVGPWRVDVNLIDFSRPNLIPSRQLTIRPGIELTLQPADLRLTGAAFDIASTPSLEYRIMRAPAVGFGYLALRVAKGTPAALIQSAFRHSDLEAGRVVLSTTVNNLERALEWELRACTSAIRQAKCSANAKLLVTVNFGNEYGPSIIRNEPLTVVDSSAVLTAAYLNSTDSDTLPAGLTYLIWQADGGLLRRRSGPGAIDEADVTSFSQADIDEERILFVRDDREPDRPAGFQFLVTDGWHQTLPTVFRVLTNEPTRSGFIDSGSSLTPIHTKPSHQVTLEPIVVVLMAANARLNVAPGVRTLITNVTLRSVAIDIRPDDLVYRIRRPPLYGRLYLNGHSDGGPVTNFTQVDVDEERLAYVAPVDPGAWSQRDAFEFTVEARGRSTAVAETVYTYRIRSSFAYAVSADLPLFLSQQDVVISYGGSVMLNASHLNLTRLAALSDDVLVLSVERVPHCGRLTRLRDIFDPARLNEDEDVDLNLPREYSDHTRYGDSESLRAFRADELMSGREIVYRHAGSDCETNPHRNDVGSENQIVLRIFALREKNFVVDGLRVELRVRQTSSDSREVITHFLDRLDIVAGGRVTLDMTKFRVDAAEASSIVYRLAQSPTDRLRLVHANGDEALITSFTQNDVNRGAIAVEHVSTKDGGDEPSAMELGVLVFRIGEADARRVLAVRVEPPAVRLVNHTDIGLAQGRTYVVLNRHLGAVRNGGPDDSHRLIYNVTRPPVNGSLYWVAGDTQARTFTQKNVNDGEILYAQLNMNAYQDSFGFMLSDGTVETVEREAYVTVVAPLAPLRPFVTRARTITQISAVHLNVTSILALSPRFFVMRRPRFGQFWLRAETNTSATFFTGVDVAEGNLYFHAFRVNRPEFKVELELILNDAQPARLVWSIDVRPFDNDGVDEAPDEIASDSRLYSQHPMDSVLLTAPPAEGRPPAANLNYYFPVLILFSLVGFIVALAFCQWRNASAAASKVKEKECRRSSMRTAGSGSDSSEGCGRAIPGLGPPRPLPDMTDLAMSGITVPVTTKAPPRGILTTSSAMPAVVTFAAGAAAGNSSDLLKSTVYATIGSPNGVALFDGQRRSRLGKSVTLVDDVESRERPADSSSRPSDCKAIGSRNAPFTAAIRSKASSSSPRRRTLSTVKEDSSAIEPPVSEFDTFGRGSCDASRDGGRHSVEVAPLVAVNPTAAATRRFLLSSRKPVAVAAIVSPSDEKLDEVTAYIKLPAISTFRDGISDGMPISVSVGSMLSPSTAIANDAVSPLGRRLKAGTADEFDSSFKSNEYWV